MMDGKRINFSTKTTSQPLMQSFPHALAKLQNRYRIYANILCIFFPEFSKEKLGCSHYLKQGWYCSASKQNDPVTR